MLVFTGGIGENDIATRAEVCAGLGTLGITLDATRNSLQGAGVISAEDSPVIVRVIPPAEDLMIVNHVVAGGVICCHVVLIHGLRILAR
jgi:acetate kinase